MVLADDFHDFLAASHGTRGPIVKAAAEKVGKAENTIWRCFGAAQYMLAKGFPLEEFDSDPPPLAVIEYVSRIGKIDPTLETKLLKDLRDPEVQMTVAEARRRFEKTVADFEAGAGTSLPLPVLTLRRLVDHVRDCDGRVADDPLPDMSGDPDLPATGRPVDPLRPTILHEVDVRPPVRPDRRTAIFIVPSHHRAVQSARFDADLRGEVASAHLQYEQVLVVSEVPVPMLEAAIATMRPEFRREVALFRGRVLVDTLPGVELQLERRPGRAEPKTMEAPGPTPPQRRRGRPRSLPDAPEKPTG